MAKSATGDKQTVIEQIQRDHRQIESLLDRVADRTGAARGDAFDELARYLAMHEAAEQEVVRPEMEKVDTEEAVDRQAEESKADALIERLRALPVDSPEFETLFATFRAAVLQHAQKEEGEEHPELEANVSHERLVEMGDDFARAEQARPQ